jgi:tetratricopeptide (TPR) repeat protein
MLRVRRMQAEILLQSGDFAQALAELETLARCLGTLAISVDVELGQVLDLQGHALRALGRRTDALAAHEAARGHLQKQLPPDHPFLLRNTLYREAVVGN